MELGMTVNDTALTGSIKLKMNLDAAKPNSDFAFTQTTITMLRALSPHYSSTVISIFFSTAISFLGIEISKTPCLYLALIFASSAVCGKLKRR
ncbi:Uncharacterised protein [Legionella cherrii]|uniref:Uncharacterized protein n=1 Tax=Legionella cherrii TaxID=28084 RepID=A0A0W0SAS4_9GAMM|nr:hypothetical protein Lche_2454 [Legionella cherrii]VEB39146.1 Uncharacterised protein [Legionella cherrii]